MWGLMFHPYHLEYLEPVLQLTNMETLIVIHHTKQAFQVIQALMVVIAVAMEEVIPALQVAMALVMEDMATAMEDMEATITLMGDHMEGPVTTGKLIT